VGNTDYENHNYALSVSDLLRRPSQTQISSSANFHSYTVHSDVIQSFISPNNGKPICFKILTFALKYTINAPTCFGLTKPS